MPMAPNLDFGGKSKKRYIKGAKASQPETVEEYLQAAVELEEAGEKWRAGDTAKALRFFAKAFECYGSGLRLFPTSFDLAYNKARLQYEISQQPKLVQQASVPLADLLHEARISHLRAVELDPSNTDVLFNLAQVNCSIAELMVERAEDDASQIEVAVNLLQQALDLFARCLESQERTLVDARNMRIADTDSEVSEQDGTSIVTEDTWATVVEPVTEETLLDTGIAQLECLQTLCDIQIIDVTHDIAGVEKRWMELKDKLHSYATPEERLRELTLAQSTFLTSLTCARSLLHLIDFETFEYEASRAISPVEALCGIQLDPKILCLAGDLYKRSGSALRHRVLHAMNTDSHAVAIAGRQIWLYVTKSLDFFTKASKHPDVQDLAQVHIERGDCELGRARLGQGPFNHEMAVKSSVTLLKNAGVYYNASKTTLLHNGHVPDAIEDIQEIEFKLALTTVLLEGGFVALRALFQRDSSSLTQHLRDAERDGLVSSDIIAQIYKAGITSTS